MDTMKTIATRCSCRSYKPEQIKDSELEAVIKAGNAAPVGVAKYETLKLTVIQDKELLEKIDVEGGKFFGDPNTHPLYGAPTLIMISGYAKDAHERELSMCNASCVIENMHLAATDLGLGSCYIMGNTSAIRENPEMIQAIGVPEDFVMCAGIILGYPAETPSERELTMDKLPISYIK